MVGIYDDMPPGIPVNPGGGPVAGGGGFVPPAPQLPGRPGPGFNIPPPTGATFEGPGESGYNPFPGAQPAHSVWPPPASAPAWHNPPWGPTWSYPLYGTWSPYSLYSPPSRPSFTPGGGGGAGQGPPLGQPIVASPWLNLGGGGGGNLHPEWAPVPERPGFGGLEAPVLVERTVSHEPRPHTPGFEVGFGGGHPLWRSLSTGATAGDSVRRSRSRSRSRSQRQRQMVANGRFLPAHDLGPEGYGPDNLARRPRDWRPDYEPRRSFIPWPRFKSDVDDYKDPVKRSLQETLSYDPSEPNVMWDLRYFPDPENLTFPCIRRIYNYIDYAQLATNPPVGRLRLFHPLLPWYIDVHQVTDNGVTVQDVIMQVYWQLRWPIHARHYFNEEFGSGIRERIAQTFELRTAGKVEERNKGIKRIDYFEDKVIFLGLVRTKDGLWEMKTKA